MRKSKLIGTKYVDRCKCGEYKHSSSKVCKICNIKKQTKRLFNLSITRKGNKISDNLKTKISIATKNSNTIHHKDGEHSNNKNNNKVIIPMRLCSRIHYDAYKYLVKIGLINKYFKWFEKRHNIKIRGINENC